MPPLSTLSKTCVALAVSQLLALPSLSHAATIVVNSNTDNGIGCTLREAIRSANTSVDQNNDCALVSASGTDTITFANSLPSNTITLTNGRLLVSPTNKDIEINASAISGGITIDAAKNSRILTADNASVTLDNLTLINGVTEGGNLGGESNGGAILAYSSNLTLRNTTVSGNTAAFNGGGIAAISSTINLYDSTVDGNVTTGGEGSPRSEGSSGGGIYAAGSESTNAGSLRLVNSTISNNASYGAGGIHASAGVNVTIDNSRLSGNTSSKTEYASGGGISANNVVMAINNSTLTDNITQLDGGGFLANSSTVTLNNSILSGNKAGDGGGFLSQSSTVILISSTLLDNSASRGGGFYSRSSITTLNNSTLSDNYSVSVGGAFGAYSGSTTLNNTTLSNNSSGRTVINSTRTIVTLNHATLSGNTAGVGHPIMDIREGFNQTGRASLINSIIANSPGVLCSGVVTTDSATIIEDGSCGASRYGDPGLLALVNNGGPTQTHALSEDSIARNSATGMCPATDQRGETRNISDGFCDVGAFEFIEGLDDLDDTNFFVVQLKNGKSVIFEL